MKRVAIIISVLALAALVIFFLMSNRSINLPRAQAQVTPSVASVPTRIPTSQAQLSRNNQVTAACKLVPIDSVDLSFNTTGLISEVLVQQGQKVSKGQLLAHLGNEEFAEAQVISAQLDLIKAQQDLKKLYDEAPLKAAEAMQTLAQAPDDVKDAENKIKGLQGGIFSQTDVDAAQANLIFAQNKLKQAQDKYQPYANSNENSLVKAKLLSDLSQAQKDYDDALRKYNSYFTAPSESSVSKAEADLALARIKQQEAQKNYEILKNGPDPDQVSLAQAQVQNAQAQLQSAQATLSSLELRAPFTGTIATVDLTPGQYVAPGTPVMLLVDDSLWRVETTDLTELNIVKVREGLPTTITFDALPKNNFPGSVLQIGSLGENRQGDITYKVTSNIENRDERLKWNMTCSMVIQTP